MSQLPKIPGLDRITEPARAKKSYPDVYLRRLVINSPPDNSVGAKASVVLQPYNHDAKEFGPEAHSIRVEFDDVQAAAARFAAAGKVKLATAMMAIVDATTSLIEDEDIRSLRNGNIIEIREPE